ncbi:unnamed protein product [Brassica rapa]|uniref:Uncharacterized protein n=2 Tax=Brassica TaxID=3705 RepID=A0A3P5YR92_BRACM|nr:unnamed protein product [Brassica napus]CAG7865305.1 unnamed protein product [Brassica rapa]VDC62388.1 unnamed protein product [Brassica rapa]
MFFKSFIDEKCPWISQRCAAGDVVRILRDSFIMSHVYIADPEDEDNAWSRRRR